MSIIIQVDNKQELIESLQSALVEGEKFAKKMFDILVKRGLTRAQYEARK